MRCEAFLGIMEQGVGKRVVGTGKRLGRMLGTRWALEALGRCNWQAC